mmetsp:Transcript_17770/g.55664  ORF Transcript_17770/g.55664 Transcript_17770/m.55664 type:complete len:230 (+) Transcript_17770:83-772(+)
MCSAAEVGSAGRAVRVRLRGWPRRVRLRGWPRCGRPSLPRVGASSETQPRVRAGAEERARTQRSERGRRERGPILRRGLHESGFACPPLRGARQSVAPRRAASRRVARDASRREPGRGGGIARRGPEEGRREGLVDFLDPGGAAVVLLEGGGQGGELVVGIGEVREVLGVWVVVADVVVVVFRGGGGLGRGFSRRLLEDGLDEELDLALLGLEVLDGGARLAAHPGGGL